MATLVQLQARLEQLKAARDSGALTVRKGDDLVTYRSLTEIDEIIAALENQIGNFDSTAPAVRRVRIHMNEGW